ncbi:MAG: alpha/beta fold hydrolase [Candidatus Nanopelagicales bacterium]
MSVNADFTPPRGWGSGHLQTVYSRVRPRRRDLVRLASRRDLLVDLDDGTGDRLRVRLLRTRQTPDGRPRRGLVLLVHGLGGSADSDYVRASAAGLLTDGYNCALVDLRSAGLSGATTSEIYHAGKSEDLRCVLRRLAVEPEARDNRDGTARLMVVGFSLGGSVTLKLLGEPLDGLPVVAGVAVSAPLDLVVGSAHLSEAMFGLYERYILHALRRDSLRPDAQGRPKVTEEERAGILRARRLPDFDDVLTAPRHGWRDAQEYYTINSCNRFLAHITVPTLVIHSLDDPMIPASPYQEIDWVALEQRGVRHLITDKGGHVGFHERGSTSPWYVPRVVDFLDEVTGDTVAPSSSP